jgi:hypothetical protein
VAFLARRVPASPFHHRFFHHYFYRFATRPLSFQYPSRLLQYTRIYIHTLSYRLINTLNISQHGFKAKEILL